MSKSKQNKQNIIQKLKEGQYKEEYVCVCRKSYMSFSSLYLHIKQKHGIMIRKSQRSFMKKRVFWSGAKRKIIFEADSEIFFDDYAGQESQQQGTVRSGQQHIQADSPYLQELPLSLRKFVEHQFEKSGKKLSKNGDQVLSQNVLKQIYQYFCLKASSINNQSALKEDLNDLPLSYNAFFMNHIENTCLKDQNPESIKKILLNLSTWLFKTKQSKYLAIDSTLPENN